MTLNRDTVEIKLFDDGEGTKAKFEFSDDFDIDTATPTEEIALLLYAYIMTAMEGEDL